MKGANDMALEYESSRSRRPLIWNRLTCPAWSVEPGREGPSFDAQPSTMWCGWKARNVMSDCFVLRRPAASEARAQERATRARERERGRTGVAELAERLAQVVHVPQLDDVVGRAPARIVESVSFEPSSKQKRREERRRTSQRWARARGPSSGRARPGAPAASGSARSSGCPTGTPARPSCAHEKTEFSSSSSARGRRERERGDALGRRELSVAASLHVHVLDPGVVHARVAPHHVVALCEAAVVHAQAAVAEPGHDDVARHLVARERRQARVGARREVLQVQ